MHTRRKAVIACITGRLAALPDLLVEKPLPENFFEENKEEVPGAAQALADPVVTLLQQWVYWTPDRNDWRQASAESVPPLSFRSQRPQCTQRSSQLSSRN